MKTEKVNTELALKMLQEGKPIVEIAKHFGVGVQAMYYHERRWIKQGKLQGKQKPIATNSPSDPLSVKKKLDSGSLSWDKIQEAILKTFIQAKEAEKLAEENWTLRNKVASLEYALREKDKKLQSANQFDLMIKQGEIPAPLLTGGEQ